MVGDIFLEIAPYLKCYTDYVNNFDNATGFFIY